MLIKKIYVLLFLLTISYITNGHNVPITYNYNKEGIWEKVFKDGNHGDLMQEVISPISYYIDAINGKDNNDGSICLLYTSDAADE